MKPFRILGIYRHPLFSNNAIEADRLILQESIARLEKRMGNPLDLEMLEEAEALEVRGEFDLVLTMAQSEKTIHAMEKNLRSSLLFNTPAAIRNCYRKTMSRLLSSLPVGYVPYQLLRTDEALPAISPHEAYWLKRSDFHAISDDDVTLAESEQEMREKLRKFRERGVQEIILQRHIHGDVYKFYGVQGKFFRAIKVRSMLTATPKVDFAGLEITAFRSAEALGLVIFGGDCILDAQGQFHLIDLNDWPSFRICREDAAEAIAALAAEHLAPLATGTRRAAVTSATLA